MAMLLVHESVYSNEISMIKLIVTLQWHVQQHEHCDRERRVFVQIARMLVHVVCMLFACNFVGPYRRFYRGTRITKVGLYC